MSWMNLHHLKYFLTIAEEGSLSGASKKLLVGQPALSAQLKSFEDWLGVDLFNRTGRKLQITPAGEYVLKYARAIKNLEEELILNLKHGDNLLKREFVLGAQESVPKTIMAHAISVTRKLRPVKLKVMEGTGEELFSLMVNGKIDFFIGNFKPMSESKELFYLSLGKEPVAVWGGKNFEKLKKDFPKSLAGKSFILSSFQNPVRHDFEKFMLQNGYDFEVGIEAQDTALQKELAARGEGLVLLGDESAKSWVNSGRLVRLGYLPSLSEQYWLGMVKRTIDNDYVKAIMNAF
jgi:LysR family transcriptional regulator, transcriptional activator of nhaA